MFLFAVGDAFRKQRGLISHRQKGQLARKLFIVYRRIHLASQVTNAGKSISPPLVLLLIFSQRKLLRFPGKQLTSLSATSPSKARATETPWISGRQVSPLSACTDELQAHFSLCTAIITYVPLCGKPPPFVTTSPPSPSKTAIPKSSLPYWSSVSDRDQAESFIRRLAALNSLHRRAQEALRDPWFTPTDAIPC